MVGLATALGATARKEVFGLPQALALIGALYIVARGFNNIHDERKDATR